MNGDGEIELLAGAPKGDSPTLPKITKDTGNVTVWQLNGMTFDELRTVYGSKKGDQFGAALAVGDVNGDDKADLIIGAPAADTMADVKGKQKPQKDAGVVSVLSGVEL
ncbi:MAG: FG-GAP-like repeat-containing protein [Pseudomonadales bacterium]